METAIPVVVNARSSPSRDLECSTDTIPPQFREEADEARLLDGLQPMDAGPYAVSPVFRAMYLFIYVCFLFILFFYGRMFTS